MIVFIQKGRCHHGHKDATVTAQPIGKNPQPCGSLFTRQRPTSCESLTRRGPFCHVVTAASSFRARDAESIPFPGARGCYSSTAARFDRAAGVRKRGSKRGLFGRFCVVLYEIRGPFVRFLDPLPVHRDDRERAARRRGRHGGGTIGGVCCPSMCPIWTRLFDGCSARGCIVSGARQLDARARGLHRHDKEAATAAGRQVWEHSPHIGR